MKAVALALLLALGGTTSVSAVPDKNVHILGQGKFRYQYRPDLLQVPATLSANWQHVHGLTLTPSNEFMVTYTTNGFLDESTRGLAKFTLSGKFIGSPGPREIARGTPHGLDGHSEDGEFYLYHSNNAGRVFKTYSIGETVWSFDTPPVLPVYEPTATGQLQTWLVDTLFRGLSLNLTQVPMTYMPCNVAFHPDEAAFYMADCYGSSYIHKFSTLDGSYQALSFGGAGEQPGQFDTPHGLIYDDRKGHLLVADRGNSRLQYVDFEGRAVAQIKAEEIQQPCDFDLLGDYLLIPDLSGHLLILDGNNEVVSKLDVADLLGDAGVKHPHDAIFLPNHDIIVATWDPGTLTYWQRVQDQ